MKNRELFEVFCKALGLYFVILAITNFKDTIFYGVGNQMLNENNSRLYFLSEDRQSILFSMEL